MYLCLIIITKAYITPSQGQRLQVCHNVSLYKHQVQNVKCSFNTRRTINFTCAYLMTCIKFDKILMKTICGEIVFLSNNHKLVVFDGPLQTI